MSIAATQLARLSILHLQMPGDAPVSAGVLLVDPANDRLYLRLRRDWDVIAPAEAAILSELESDLTAKSQDLGAARLLDRLQDTLSNVLTISEPREGRLVLVEYLGGGANDRHTVKRYHSRKHQNADGTWAHEIIRLEPLNPEFEAWELNPEEDRFHIVAEFIQVLY